MMCWCRMIGVVLFRFKFTVELFSLPLRLALVFGSVFFVFVNDYLGLFKVEIAFSLKLLFFTYRAMLPFVSR